MRFFFDRNISSRLARMVDALDAEHIVRAHDDDGRFNPMTPDVEWIRVLAADEPRWIVVSGDGRILRNRIELAAVKEAKLIFFCLNKQWMHMKFYEQAWKLIKVWPDVVENARGATPRIYEISGGAGLKVERLDV